MNVQLTNRAKKDIQKLPNDIVEQIRKAILSLSQNPLQGIKLSGQWIGYRRFRSGDYRIIYRIDNNETLIYFVRHRKEAYR